MEDELYRGHSERDKPMRTPLKPGLSGPSVTFVTFGISEQCFISIIPSIEYDYSKVHKLFGFQRWG